MNLIFATHNQHKTDEVRAMVGKRFTILNLKDIGSFEEIPETADTLQGNALLKARYVYDKFGMDCFADDTGLEVEALDGRPGVFSARYAGESCSFQDNIRKLLMEMEGVENRKASFITVVALILKGEEFLFQGKIEGEITTGQHGSQGFGYDSVFRPTGFDRTFAELGDDEKNKISHRAVAINQLLQFLHKS